LIYYNTITIYQIPVYKSSYNRLKSVMLAMPQNARSMSQGTMFNRLLHTDLVLHIQLEMCGSQVLTYRGTNLNIMLDLKG